MTAQYVIAAIIIVGIAAVAWAIASISENG